ncbi:MAG: sugar phosphate isomerase/epimerase [Anaerolineae bacterium]|nr:sugar phosphate isomerase/epimerase [Anaerolineae bacterium]
MKISVVTDEISSDVETAVELAAAWGIHDLELRGMGKDRVPFISPYEKERLKETLAQYGSRIVAISPGLFKMPYPPRKRDGFPVQAIDWGIYQRWQSGRDLLRYHLDQLLPEALSFCGEFGAQVMVAFSFEKDDPAWQKAPEEILEALDHAARQCGNLGITLALEVEAGFWASTGATTAEIMRAVNNPALGVNWDPGNAFFAGDTPFPDGYLQVKPYVRHVHFKDAVSSGGSLRYAVEGEIDWQGQIDALNQDGYAGFISVETHMRPKVTSAQAATRRLRQLVSSA